MHGNAMQVLYVAIPIMYESKREKGADSPDYQKAYVSCFRSVVHCCKWPDHPNHSPSAL